MPWSAQKKRNYRWQWRHLFACMGRFVLETKNIWIQVPFKANKTKSNKMLVSCEKEKSGPSMGNLLKQRREPTNPEGHFRVHVCLLFQASLSAKFFLWKLVFIRVESRMFHWTRDQTRQYGDRTVFNLTRQFDLKYKEIALALGLTNVQNKLKINANNFRT